MQSKSEMKKLVEVKSALADKYMRLAAVRKSKPAKARLYRQAEVHRQQAVGLTRLLERR